MGVVVRVGMIVPMGSYHARMLYYNIGQVYRSGPVPVPAADKKAAAGGCRF